MRTRIAGLAALLSLCLGACAGVAGRAAGEAAEEATEPIVSETLEAFADPENRARMAAILSSPEMRRATANLTAGAVDGMILSLSSQQSVEAFAPNVGLLAREIARQVTLGVDDAFSEISTRPTPHTGIGSIVRGAEEATTASAWLLPIGAGLLALALVAAIVLLWRTTRRAQRERVQAEERERAFALLAATLQEAEQRPWSGELREMLYRRARGDDRPLEALFGRRPEGGAPPHH